MKKRDAAMKKKKDAVKKRGAAKKSEVMAKKMKHNSSVDGGPRQTQSGLKP